MKRPALARTQIARSIVSSLFSCQLLSATLFAGSLLVLPAAHATAPPVAREETATVELVFVLDTTGSMGGLLEGAKTKIWSIVNGIMQQRKQQNVQVRVGLIAYRDRGDDYVTKVTPLTSDLDEVYAQLMGLRAQGGGDTPEDVRTALVEALDKSGWSQSGPRTSQIMFLVGDAPPHDDYVQVQTTTASAKKARQQGIIINTIQCGSMQETIMPWRNIAQFGGGEYFAIEQNGGVTAIATPYDPELARLGEQVGATYLAYGRADMRHAKQAKQSKMEMSVSAAAPMAAQADRAVNKALNSHAYDEADLVQEVARGNTSLAKVAEAELPEALAKLKPEERQAKLDQMILDRKALQAKIIEVSKKRDEYLARQASKTASGSGFDARVSQALAKQIK